MASRHPAPAFCLSMKFSENRSPPRIECGAGFFRIMPGTARTRISRENTMAPSPQKVALITGAARGIGLATAKRFLAEGWRVALLDIDGELLHGAVAGLANPDDTLALHCDVSDADGVTAAMDAVSRRFGRLDAL